MSFIEYITEANTDAAAALCQNHGMQPQSLDDIAGGLMMIIDEEGAAGLNKVLSLHPDKDVIVENFAPNTSFRNASGGNSGGCGNCKLASMLVKTNQASGGTSAMAPNPYPYHNQQNNSNNLLIIGIISLTVIAGLIIHKNNN